MCVGKQDLRSICALPILFVGMEKGTRCLLETINLALSCPRWGGWNGCKSESSVSSIEFYRVFVFETETRIVVGEYFLQI